MLFRLFRILLVCNIVVCKFKMSAKYQKSKCSTNKVIGSQKREREKKGSELKRVVSNFSLHFLLQIYVFVTYIIPAWSSLAAREQL